MSRQPSGTPSIPLFRLSAGLCLLLSVGMLPGVSPRPGSPDPEFTRLPFAEWAAQGKHADLRWDIEPMVTLLSAHQRLMVRLTVTVDGRELAKRRGKGSLTALVQLEDSAGAIWQNHGSIDLASIEPGVAGSDVQMIHYAFVLPGDYAVSIAVCDTATLEHSFATRKLHVAALKDDPLPGAWRGLPTVEFIREDSGAPDIWYLPEVANGLNLPIATRRPVHVEFVVNATPSERAAGSLTAMRRNMGLLVPAMKIFSFLKPDKGSVDAALLDLTRRRVAWEQKAIGRFDWTGLRQFLQEAEPGKIDVHALLNQRGMRTFFFNDIDRRMHAPDKMAHVVIVLSGPAFLPDQEPLAYTPSPPNADTQLIYIRDYSLFSPPRRRHAAGPFQQQAPPVALPPDDLEQVLQPFNPRVYDSSSADQFRRILAEILRQIAAITNQSAP